MALDIMEMDIMDKVPDIMVQMNALLPAIIPQLEMLRIWRDRS